jgi:hypothetical protein
MNPGFPGIITFEKPRRIDMLEMMSSSFASCFSTKRKRKESEKKGNVLIKCVPKLFPFFLGF